jgi:RND family efflux transporter MFP subunit
MLRLTPSALLAVLLSGVALSAETPAVPLAVEVVVAHAATQTRDYSLTGELRARDSVAAAFPIAGRISEILVEQGQTVTAGAILARMDAVQQQQALRAAEAGLSTADADHRQAAEDLRRAETLLARGATTRAARDAAEDKMQITAGALAQAGADLDRARKALNDTELTAPADATVTERMAEAGQVVGAAQPVLELALSGGIEAVFEVPEVLLTGKTRPSVLRLSPLGDPGAEFDGVIGEVSPLVDATTGTVAVTVRIPEPPRNLSYGEAVRGTATIAEPARIVLPYTVLSATNDGPAVWLVDAASGAVSLKPVEVERYETSQIVLNSGLDDGDRIVARGAQLLYPGRVVRAVEVTQ